MKIKIVQINQKIVQAYINKGYVRGTSGVARTGYEAKRCGY